MKLHIYHVRATGPPKRPVTTFRWLKSSSFSMCFPSFRRTWVKVDMKWARWAKYWKEAVLSSRSRSCRTSISKRKSSSSSNNENESFLSSKEAIWSFSVGMCLWGLRNQENDHRSGPVVLKTSFWAAFHFSIFFEGCSFCAWYLLHSLYYIVADSFWMLLDGTLIVPESFAIVSSSCS